MNFNGKEQALTLEFEQVGMEDTAYVGGKNASLGEMIGGLKGKGIKVPDGFATTSKAYWDFIEHNNLKAKIEELLGKIQREEIPLSKGGKEIRSLFLSSSFPDKTEKAILDGYYRLCRKRGKVDLQVAVRSSSTFEDLPEASFAGQQETYLNISGENNLLHACLKCFASLFTDRAIAYRNNRKMNHMSASLSVGVQEMVRSDLAGAGVAFTLDTESGFPRVVLINASWGLGEAVVKGIVNPDQYLVFKPLLNQSGASALIGKDLGSKERKIVYSRGGDNPTEEVKTSGKEKENFVLSEEEIYFLSRQAVIIEEHYGKAMDIEWAKDGQSGEIYIVQARPETAHSQKRKNVLSQYKLKDRGKKLVEGLSIGSAIASGKARVIEKADELDTFVDGEVLVARMTDPDWGPVMKKAAAIVTDEGGRACHAAIVGRELGIPVVVGTGKATQILHDGMSITVSCAVGERGRVYKGALNFDVNDIDLDSLPKVETKVMINAADPSNVFNWWKLPAQGIGLARMEFIINNLIQIHPMALVKWPNLENKQARDEINALTKGYEDKKEYFVDKLTLALGKMAASQWPHSVIVRFSDFKTNEYAQLIGGQEFEKEESNPMLGFRGASRYYDDRYRDGFALECAALKRAREQMGFLNLVPMVPFCRTLKEADQVLAVMSENGLKRGDRGLEIFVMAEIPSNIILADGFAKRFDGFSIGSNDLTQLTLGVDRDSRELAKIFDERDEAVKRMILLLIDTAKKFGRPVGICGEAPSNYPEFAAFLIEAGISSISLNPDSAVKALPAIARAETAVEKANGQASLHPH